MKNEKLEWADYVFDPWIGCTKVSEGCRLCYAETQQAGRVKWGKGEPREKTSNSYWHRPITWNKQADGTNKPPRVFCGSLCDVFDQEVDPDWRKELWYLIDMTPNLDWLLLTKRPKEMLECIGQLGSRYNIWLGVSVENQRTADERIPMLLKAEAPIHFLNVRPLLGPVNLFQWMDQIDWIMAGGEMGPTKKTTEAAWISDIRDACHIADVPFFLKNWTGSLKSPDRSLDGTIHRATPAQIR